MEQIQQLQSNSQKLESCIQNEFGHLLKEFENFVQVQQNEINQNKECSYDGVQQAYDMFVNQHVNSEDIDNQLKNQEFKNKLNIVPTGYLKLISYLYLLIQDRSNQQSKSGDVNGIQSNQNPIQTQQIEGSQQKTKYHYELAQKFLQKEREKNEILETEIQNLKGQIALLQSLQNSEIKQKFSESNSFISPSKPPLQHNLKLSKQQASKVLAQSSDIDLNQIEQFQILAKSCNFDPNLNKDQQSNVMNNQDIQFDQIYQSESGKFYENSPEISNIINPSAYIQTSQSLQFQKQSKSLTPNCKNTESENQYGNQNQGSLIQKLRDQSREKYLDKNPIQTSQKKLDFSDLKKKLTPYLANKKAQEQNKTQFQLQDLDLLNREAINFKHEFPTEVKQLEAEDEFFSTSPSSNKSSMKKQNHIQQIPYFNTQSTLQQKNSIAPQAQKEIVKEQIIENIMQTTENPFERRRTQGNQTFKRSTSNVSKVKDADSMQQKMEEVQSPMFKPRKRQNSITSAKHSEISNFLNLVNKMQNIEKIKSQITIADTSLIMNFKMNPYKQIINKKPPSIKRQNIFN